MKIDALFALAIAVAGGVQLGAQQASVVTTGRVGAPAAPRVVAAPERQSWLATIHGTALTSTSAQLPNATVRLRDTRFGRIVDRQLTDGLGLFEFRGLDPGTYIVELMSTDQKAVVAASELLSVDRGDSVSAIVKLPSRVPPFGGLFRSTATQAALVTTAAAASGVLAVAIPAAEASPR